MKKILLIILVAISFSYSAYAAEDGTNSATGATNVRGTVTVEVTEKVPGVNCYGTPGKYECQVGTGFSAISQMIGQMVKYFTYITALAAVLFIVINGILYSMAGINDGLKTSAKDRIIKTLIGLVLLLLTGVILNALAPWIYSA